MQPRALAVTTSLLLACTSGQTEGVRPADGGAPADEALDARLPPVADGSAPADGGAAAPADAGSTDAAPSADAAPVRRDAASPVDAGDARPPLDCAGFSQAGHAVCSATPDACNIVFYDRSGCRAACASAGMDCAASYRDDDDNGRQCRIHPSRESFACAETNNMSDFCECRPRQRAFVGAEGFGAFAAGGRGGRTYTVTTLADSGSGSLRWAVERSGRRIVQFAVDGVIQLRSALRIRDPYITIDGRGALMNGGRGITVRDYPIDIRTNDVVIRYIRVRLGDYAVLRRVAQSGASRPRNSNDLDCINIDRSRNVIIDHVSMSWSTDEIVSITNSRNVTIQWSIMSEPIGNRRAHPYGDNHAFAANNSAATLTYHHNLFAHFRLRGPQFEANDMQNNSPRFDASFEAINNVVYGYTSSGSRYRTGFERAADKVTSVDFSYHFIGNTYVNASSRTSEIQAHDAYGHEPNIRLYVSDNIGPNRPNASGDQLAVVFTDSGGRNPIRRARDSLAQVSARPLFSSPAPVQVQSPQDARRDVLAGAGCSIGRDAIDQRIVDDVRAVRRANIIASQEDVPGGWPTYR